MNTYEHYAAIRDSLGLRDSQVSDATGISRSSFSDWKYGKSTPKIDKLQKIAVYLGVSVSQITENENDGTLPSYQNELLELILKLNPQQRRLITQLVKGLLHNS